MRYDLTAFSALYIQTKLKKISPRSKGASCNANFVRVTSVSCTSGRKACSASLSIFLLLEFPSSSFLSLLFLFQHSFAVSRSATRATPISDTTLQARGRRVSTWRGAVDP